MVTALPSKSRRTSRIVSSCDVMSYFSSPVTSSPGLYPAAGGVGSTSSMSPESETSGCQCNISANSEEKTSAAAQKLTRSCQMARTSEVRGIPSGSIERTGSEWQGMSIMGKDMRRHNNRSCGGVLKSGCLASSSPCGSERLYHPTARHEGSEGFEVCWICPIASYYLHRVLVC